MNIFLYTILFIIGAFCGSFSELTAYRLPLKISWKKRAFCEKCNKLVIPEIKKTLFKKKFFYKCNNCKATNGRFLWCLDNKGKKLYLERRNKA